MLKLGWADAATLAAWQQEAVRKVDDVINTTQREPAPDPYTEKWSALSTDQLQEGRDVYSGGPANI